MQNHHFRSKTTKATPSFKVKEKIVKEKKGKEKKSRSPSDKPSLLAEARKASPFTVMLFISAASLFIAVLLLLIEWGSYGFTISSS